VLIKLSENISSFLENAYCLEDLTISLPTEEILQIKGISSGLQIRNNYYLRI
jgi:hypothetical protein